MAIKGYFIGIILAVTGLASLGQTMIVVDQQNQSPIPGALVIAENPLIYLTTSEEGKVNLSSIKGFDQLVVRVLGYKTLSVSKEQLINLNYQVEMSPAPFNLDDVVISAARWNQTSNNVPQKVVRISKRTVELQNPQTAADLLGLSGKVFVQKSQQGGGSPMIRGFATNRLIYSVDGVRMNTAIFRGGNIQNVINLDPFAISDTEVAFGPGSVMYGSDAIGGVMSFKTLRPPMSSGDELTVSGNLSGRFSSANTEQTGHLDVQISGKKWGFISSISQWDYGHLRQGSQGPIDYVKPLYVQPRTDANDTVVDQEDELLQIPTAYKQFNHMQKLRFQPNEKWDMTYALHFSSTTSYSRYDRHNQISNGLPRYSEWEYGPQSWMMNHLHLAYQSDGRLFDKSSINLTRQDFEESRITRILNDPQREVKTENVTAHSINLDFIKSMSSDHTINYGIEYIHNGVDSRGEITDLLSQEVSEGASRYPNASWQSLGAFFNDQYQVNPNWTMQAGLRYNQYLIDADFDTTFYPFPFTTTNTNKGALTGSIGSTVRPDEKTVLSLNFGTAFRAPNIDDIGKVFDSEPGSVTVPNPELQAEYAYNVDAGLTRIFKEIIKVELTGYYTILNQAMVRRNFQLNGQDSISYEGTLSQVQALQNATSSYVYGFQFGFEYKAKNGLSFSTDLNFQQGEEEMDDGSQSPSRHAAPFFGVSRLIYKKQDWILELNSQYQGTRTNADLSLEERPKSEIYAIDANGNTYAPGWYTLNLKSQWKFRSWLSLNAGIENITDQRYRPYSSGISGPGRNWVLSLSASF